MPPDLEMISCLKIPGTSSEESYLSDTLAVLSSEKDSPCNATGVLALEEQRLGLAVLESEDLAVATDVELTLRT